MFEAIFAEGLPEIGEGECLERAEAVGLSGEAFARELASPGPERRLAETAAEAHSAGAFGVPTCRLAMPKSVRGNSPRADPGSGNRPTVPPPPLPPAPRRLGRAFR
jgi:predicted DsbA family dithiol-disulfide isomerase